MNALGSALARLGERENGTERLKEAIETYRTALEEHTRERVPVDWAVTQSNLGNTLTNLGQLEISLGQLEIGTERLQEAVQAYQFALQELRECGGTYYLEIVQAGLARVLSIIAQREELVEGH
jgi:tetratricopeptide (TPR) repeat protein